MVSDIRYIYHSTKLFDVQLHWVANIQFYSFANTNYYIITGLSDNVNYAVSIANVDMCGVIITSDPINIITYVVRTQIVQGAVTYGCTVQLNDNLIPAHV